MDNEPNSNKYIKIRDDFTPPRTNRLSVYSIIPLVFKTPNWNANISEILFSKCLSSPPSSAHHWGPPSSSLNIRCYFIAVSSRTTSTGGVFYRWSNGLCRSVVFSEARCPASIGKAKVLSGEVFGMMLNSTDHSTGNERKRCEIAASDWWRNGRRGIM